MKYFLSPAFLLFIIECSFGQEKIPKGTTTDSLKIYSYYIGFEIVKFYSSGQATIIAGNGTGFFIRKKDDLYLITAKHNIAPCENREKLFFKNLYVWLQDEHGIPTQKISIDPIQFLQIPCHEQHNDNDTDAIAIKVISPLPVYSIESFLTNIPTEYDEVQLWGYPENKKDTSKRKDYELISNTFFPPNSYSFETLRDSTKNITDWTNSYLVSKTVSIDDSRHGYSGSPVFMKNKKTKKWVFIGLNWGHGNFGGGEKYLELVRPNVLLKLIESFDGKYKIE